MNDMRKLMETVERVDEDDRETQELVYELQEIKEHIKSLMEDAQSIIGRNFRGQIEDRAKSYWIPHILMALDDDHGYVGGSMCSMEDTINEIMASGEGEEDEY